MGFASSPIGRLLGLLTPEEKEYKKKYEAEKLLKTVKHYFPNDDYYNSLLKYNEMKKNEKQNAEEVNNIILAKKQVEKNNRTLSINIFEKECKEKIENIKRKISGLSPLELVNNSSENINENNNSQNSQLDFEIQIKEKELELLKLKAQLNRDVEK